MRATLARVALAISARNQGRQMISPGTNAEELAEAALKELVAAWEERWGDQHPGVIALRAVLAGTDKKAEGLDAGLRERNREPSPLPP